MYPAGAWPFLPVAVMALIVFYNWARTKWATWQQVKQFRREAKEWEEFEREFN